VADAMIEAQKGEHTMQKSFFLVTVLASTLTLAVSTGALAQTDPAALLEKLLEAIARGDVAGALALYADDAVWDGGTVCAAAPCVGKAAIQKALERLAANKTHVHTTLKNYVSGNVVTSRFEVRDDTIKKAGVEQIIGWWIVETKGEKIAYLRAGIPDRSDAQTARFAEWQRAQPPAR
jgi:ketosteroid isomerase-like protein